MDRYVLKGVRRTGLVKQEAVHCLLSVHLGSMASPTAQWDTQGPLNFPVPSSKVCSVYSLRGDTRRRRQQP